MKFLSITHKFDADEDSQFDVSYEQQLLLPGRRIRYPDFTINDAGGTTFYWEHLGLLDDLEYSRRWESKKAEYFDAGIRPWQGGGAEIGTLIETRDGPGGGLDAGAIASLIEKVLE